MELVTGFKSLDETIGGLQYGSLVTLAGRPCMRTLYFIHTMMRSWIKSNLIKEGFVFFSLKDRKERVYRHLFGTDYTDEAAARKNSKQVLAFLSLGTNFFAQSSSQTKRTQS